jgi:hypothetical protein
MKNNHVIYFRALTLGALPLHDGDGLCERDAQQRAAPGFVRAILDYAVGQLVADQQWLSEYQEGTST